MRIIKGNWREERPSPGVNIDFQTANQHHLRNAEKRDRVRHAKGAGQLG